jgi:hypothetical protein
MVLKLNPDDSGAEWFNSFSPNHVSVKFEPSPFHQCNVMSVVSSLVHVARFDEVVLSPLTT